MNSAQQQAMSEALDQLRLLFPNQAIIIITAFEHSDGATICSASNMDVEGQISMLLELANDTAQTYFSNPTSH